VADRVAASLPGPRLIPQRLWKAVVTRQCRAHISSAPLFVCLRFHPAPQLRNTFLVLLQHVGMFAQLARQILIDGQRTDHIAAALQLAHRLLGSLHDNTANFIAPFYDPGVIPQMSRNGIKDVQRRADLPGIA
jgi:hypothetical protein